MIGPSLGQDNIRKGGMAVLLGLLAVLLCAALYYHLFGLIAEARRRVGSAAPRHPSRVDRIGATSDTSWTLDSAPAYGTQ